MSKAENALLFMDLLQCPYVEKQLKKDIVKKVFEIEKDNEAYMRLKRLEKKHKCFFDWSESRDIMEFIKKKSYKSPYQ